MIENNFDGVLEFHNLEQHNKNHSHYRNRKYGIQFFHDFVDYLPLQKQLPKVKQKYIRRIQRFFESICEPTLFVRYISNESVNEDGKSIELTYIEKNYDRIMGLLKGFNEHNDIVFIANSDVHSELLKIYNVEADYNDVVARKPFDKNEELSALFKSFPFEERELNILRFEKKYRRKKLVGCVVHCMKKGAVRVIRCVLGEYSHDKQY